MATTPPMETDDARIVARADGFYWLADDGRCEVGPFATAAEAAADRHSAEENELAPDATREEAEAELGIADWIDPETGLPAEDARTHIEDH
ncbi:MAG: hypothetical protein OHK0044_23970 [Burkholderiaceae bacterium]